GNDEVDRRQDDQQRQHPLTENPMNLANDVHRPLTSHNLRSQRSGLRQYGTFHFLLFEIFALRAKISNNINDELPCCGRQMKLVHYITSQSIGTATFVSRAHAIASS